MLAGWRTGLPGPVLVLQAGTAVNYFGAGLILPFEIIYLHQARGFPTATAGLVLAAIMGTAALVTPLSGALLDRFRAKPVLITGNLASALGYAGFAFAGRPWQAFACAAVGGAGFGVATTANQVLTLTLVPAEHRASSIALGRVAGNFGLGSGATVAGFIIAAASNLRAFQALYLFDGLTYAVFALVVLVGIPNPHRADAASASASRTGFRAVARDRLFLILIAASIVLVMVGGAKTRGSLDDVHHAGRRMDGQRMGREARPGSDIGGHFPSEVELPSRCFHEQRDHQVLQRDHANSKLHQLGICQRRGFGKRIIGD